MANLFQHSIHVIRTHQTASGAYPACPNFPTYRYSWFRDGAFIAYAMDVAGQHDSARRFHDWVARTLLRHTDKAERAIEKAAHAAPLGEDYLHTRYAIDGKEGPDDWPNFQLDGLGTWLWALAEHAHRTSGLLVPEWRKVVDLVARYLSALWLYPCYDLWEEHAQYLHPYTLAAIYAGLKAADSVVTVDGWPPAPRDSRDSGQALSEAEGPAVIEEIRRFLLEHGVRNDHLIKYIALSRRGGVSSSAPPHPGSSAPQHPGSPAQIDASLIGVATPYRLLLPDDPIMQATVARIEAELHCPGGGIHRYLTDTYYGGGEWVLLAGWLGWYYAEMGEQERAGELLRWIEAQADADGHLPEQVSTHLLVPGRYGEWEARWGPVAKPLLWSHAMYLILHQALESPQER